MKPRMADFARVMSHLQQGRQDEAEASARDFTNRHSASPMAWNLLGYVQLQGEHVEAARQSFRRALEINPENIQAMYYLAFNLVYMEELDEALMLLDKALSLSEIGWMLGFSDQSSFSRAFRRWVGGPPSDFRQLS